MTRTSKFVATLESLWLVRRDSDTSWNTSWSWFSEWSKRIREARYSCSHLNEYDSLRFLLQDKNKKRWNRVITPFSRLTKGFFYCYGFVSFRWFMRLLLQKSSKTEVAPRRYVLWLLARGFFYESINYRLSLMIFFWRREQWLTFYLCFHN